MEATWPGYIQISIKLRYRKTCEKRSLSKRPKIVFQDQLSLNAGQKYCRMLQGEHSAILSTFSKLPFVIKIFVLSISEWPFYTGFTVCHKGTALYFQETEWQRCRIDCEGAQAGRFVVLIQQNQVFLQQRPHEKSETRYLSLKSSI